MPVSDVVAVAIVLLFDRSGGSGTWPLIIFIPLFVGGVAFVALLFAAATAGSGDAFEQRPQEETPVAEGVLSQVAPSKHSSVRAA